jgi:peptidoglycan/xylan/chitin deacetylase (PgdA/CDA1 family)
LKENNTKASFFFTGRFYRNPAFANTIQQLKKGGHYLGAHSNDHLLYCDWKNRDSLLLTKEEFTKDLLLNYKAMQDYGISKKQARFFLPPFEWYNDSIAAWTKDVGLQLINFSPGTVSHADYTTPDATNYRSSETILQSIVDFESTKTTGFNGFILLLHIGTDPKRIDKFYYKLPFLLEWFKKRGYKLTTIEQLLPSLSN